MIRVVCKGVCCSLCELDAVVLAPYTARVEDGAIVFELADDTDPTLVFRFREFHEHKAPLSHRHTWEWNHRVERARLKAREAQDEVERLERARTQWFKDHPR